MYWSRFRVWGGLILALAATTRARPCTVQLGIGSVLFLLGSLWRVWASGYLYKNQALAMTGPYAWHRHPLYFGTFLMGLGVGLCAHVTWYWPLFLGFFVVVYGTTMAKEDRWLQQRFGESYRDYRERIPTFWPLGWLNPVRPTASEPCAWSWEQVCRNREHRTLIAVMVWVAVFWIQWWLQGKTICP